MIMVEAREEEQPIVSESEKREKAMQCNAMLFLVGYSSSLE